VSPTTKAATGLLPSGLDVPFAEIEATLAHLVKDGRRRRRGPARALTATVIVIAPPARLTPAAEALEQLGEIGGVRAILISEGKRTAPSARVTETAIAISGLAPRFLNNAVASLRLSSLPAVVWWRGGAAEALDDLANLADRLILDASDPDDAWSHARSLLEHTALTDLRWTALTRWRAALAHLFDLPQVRDGVGTMNRLEIDTRDVPAARLFAGWVQSSLRWKSSVPIAIRKVRGEAPTPLVCVKLVGSKVSITLAVKAKGDCLEAGVDRLEAGTRIVPLGDGSLRSLIGEELGIRTRDLAFEHALAAAREIRA
jgi:hypothetical protein